MGKFERFFNNIAAQLDLSESQEQNIKRSYESVGDTLINDYVLSDYKPIIFPQGSVRLGTVVKPLKKDDYDIDLVCELTEADNLKPNLVKNLVGHALKNSKYKNQLEEEHGRCWTLVYKDNPPYHLDILPGVLIVNNRVNATAKNDDGTYKWLTTNPKGFAEWFLGLYKQKERLLEDANIEKIHLYDNRNPLQRAVQLIKRHRDVYFKDNPDKGPASIIITALSGLSYNGEQTIEDILKNGPITWIANIKKDNDKYFIKIPKLPDDNYADKWNGEDPKAPNIFFEWHAKLIEDLDKLFRQKNVADFLSQAKTMFDVGTIDKVINENKTIFDSLNESFSQSKMLPMTLENTHPLFPHAKNINNIYNFIPRPNIKVCLSGDAFDNEADRNRNANSFVSFSNCSPLLKKNVFLRFTASIINCPKHFFMLWQITNTGKEAKESLRGGFERSEKDIARTKFETTSYSGTHFVQAFLIDNDTKTCVAKSNILKINIGVD